MGSWARRQHVSNDITRHKDIELQVLLPDIARLSQNIDNRRRASSLLRRLTCSAGAPGKYQTVARETARDIQEAGEVPGRDVQSRDGDDESYNRDGHRYDDVPAAFVDPIAVVRHCERDQGANQIRRGCADEGDGAGA